MNKFLLFIIFLTLTNCGSESVEKNISARGSVIEIGGCRFTVPENCFSESTKIRIAKKGVAGKQYEQGYRLCGGSFVIEPETTVFEKSVLFSCPAKNGNMKLGAKIGKGFVPLAESRVVGETLQAPIWHGGEYYIVETPEKYGILNYSKSDSALLVVSDIYVSDYIANFTKILKESGYPYPIWIYIYSAELPIEENAILLAEELKKLHEQYGNFRVDVVSFGIGGLIAHRYIADTTFSYQNDISPSIIAVGTPFFGSNLAIQDSTKKSCSPYRFFYIDGLGENVQDLKPGSNFVKWISENRKLPGWQRKSLEENKNFASIRGKAVLSGTLPEEYNGDGLVSLSSTMLTFIEPEPFPLSHFDLFESKNVHGVISEFTKLYRDFNWPMLFTKVWRGEENASRISKLWDKEANLNFRRRIDFEVLLEWNSNMLKSAPEDAILITNGDNDTYPAWYLQQQNGLRNDVLIVNWNLLNTADYIRFLKKNGLPLELPSEKIDSLRPYIDKKTHEIVYIADYIIKLLLQQKSRPIVFSTTLKNPQKYDKPLKLTGVVYEIGKGDADINTENGNVSVDVTRTEQLFDNEFILDKTLSIPVDSLSQQIQGLAQNYAAAAFQLSVALVVLGKYDDALRQLDFAKRFRRSPMFLYNEALIYFTKMNGEKADSILKEILSMADASIDIKKTIAALYYDKGKKDAAIKILAECLKMNPNDRGITELIKKHQGE